MNLKFILGLLLIAFSSKSFAANLLSFGGVDGGGGKGILCNTANGRTVESLDLNEARYVWGYDIPASADLDTEVMRIMPIYWSAVFEEPTQAPFKYDDKSFKFFRDMYQRDFIDYMRFIPVGTRLRPTEDATIILEPPTNCQIVQVLVYLDEGTNTSGIVADKDYWDLLDDQNRLAFYLHERDYKGFRMFTNVRSSDTIRKYIGALFATTPFPSRIGNIRKAKSALRCETRPSDPADYNKALFYVTPRENPGEGNSPQTNIYFDSFGKFGKKKGPVEYRADSVTTMNYFRGQGGPGMYGGTLFVNSIVGGERIDLIGKERCTTGQTWGCPVDLFLSKKKPDDTTVQEQISCEAINIVPN